ncbi:hypothetical protein DOY81_004267 [Sarcophaga bullata]|nr:hypothetical protein DOY81_004267 [Sarcophaga bullata]
MTETLTVCAIDPERPKTIAYNRRYWCNLYCTSTLEFKNSGLFKVIAVVCLAIAVTKATPVPQNHIDAVTDFLRNDQLPLGTQESAKVKRRIYEENNDRQLKQISLSSLIGDLEQGLFASALSVNKVLTDKNVNIPEIKSSEHDIQHEVTKRHSEEETENTESSTKAASTETVTSETPLTHKILLQTTEKVPEGNGKPAHIVIDRIAIQPHTGGVAFIPIFELKRTVNADDQTKDHEITKITISKTEITGLANLSASKLEEVSSSTTTATTESLVNSETTTTDATTLETTTIADSSYSTTTTTETTTPTTSTPTSTLSSSSTETVVLEASTTPKNIEQLKEAEEELKEKVAEIEAEPIILSARV